MTDPTPQPGNFDSLISDPGTRHRTTAPAPARRWVWPAVTAGLALLGAGALAAAALVPSTGIQPAASDPAVPIPTATAAPTRTPTASVSPAARTNDTPIAELADPAWVTRIAAAGNIPERALYAYAGAAIEVSTTSPSCGLGWNTLAAIGLVETEHGSMNNATLNPDGTVTPAIIGIPLDGNGTNPVPDTDVGKIDGDTTWDRAVGPMQFIPSTWEAAAQDGNRDGTKDINQIDDAALGTAMHLCDVGGDLTKAENWIAAINAYNPSVDYNNRVAEAATHYATLR